MSDLLKKLIERRHPEYTENLAHWNFLEDTYEGGREWFDANIFRYMKEGTGEFASRVERAYRFNHTREVVDLVNKYLFKVPVARRAADAPDAVKQFWAESTRNELDIDSYSSRISRLSSIYGRVWVVVDSTSNGEVMLSKADEKSGEVRIYSYTVQPQQVLDMSYSDDGNLRWILIHERARDDADPFTSSGSAINRYRLWTDTDWRLFEAKRQGRKTVIEEVDSGEHNLGVVPVFPADHTISEELYEASGLIDDVAYLDRAVANYLSNLDAIIQDQTFSQLAMPAQGILPGEKAFDKLLEMGTKRIFTFDGEAGQVPFYLSPDVKQAELILQAIMKIINEIYHSVGLAGERTKDDNGGGADNASGVAKGMDFERTNALLAAKADSMEKIENRLVELVCKWAGVEVSDSITGEHTLVKYPKNFDTRGLYDEFEIGARLTLLNAPDGVRREQMKQLIAKLFPSMSIADREELESELKDWPPEDALPGLGQSGKASSGVGGNPVAAAGAQKTAKSMAA